MLWLKYFNKISHTNKPHIEAAKGTNQQAIDYCKKEGAFIEYGIAPV